MVIDFVGTDYFEQSYYLNNDGAEQRRHRILFRPAFKVELAPKG